MNTSKILTYLALGDSYTIGEGIPIYENFPSQTIQLLRKQGLLFYAPEIIAKTGWTTDELKAGMEKTHFLHQYDLVTLLIGVNNQYREYDINVYRLEFEQLLKQAIRFAGDQSRHVIVLSIPDWGVTPFAEGRDRKKIGEEIDQYNNINKEIALKHGVHYIDITPGTRKAAEDISLLAGDLLHYSGKAYEEWAKEVTKMGVKIFKQ